MLSGNETTIGTSIGKYLLSPDFGQKKRRNLEHPRDAHS